uniref:Cytochrome c oxidase subunit 3 n=1 Tax=Clavelina lepadiformis TaxID=159417 RepID=C6GCS2_CLALP|nr:cytochrome c oxidase subunit III [Clavelina lepadiformis]ACO40311.1 cytochrome c oxidase subunit III [Clavelina lepadiformis]
MRNTPFHLVDNSPWPFFGSMAFFFFVSGALFMFKMSSMSIFFVGVVFIFFLSFFWWRDVVRESLYLGFHTASVQSNLLIGMVWFISSEVLFFFGFFWSFFHSSLGVCVDLFSSWPPTGVEVLNPLGVPLLNTLVLLSSGFSVTWAHYSLLLNNYSDALFGMLFTIGLGMFFTLLQAMEYLDGFFLISDSVYGSVFFMATGFHGFHVIVGSLFLLVSSFRMFLGQFNMNHHIGLECSIWYWHFVDVVWLFLYISIYWWGSII